MEAAIFDDLTVLGDALRSRMLVLLERHELTVGELCAVLQLPQSTVSRHLKVLGDADWVTSRRDGTSRYYSSNEPPHATAGKLWSLLREQVGATPAADQDARRLKSVMTRRQTASQQFFETGAGRWDKLREEMFGRCYHLQALTGSARRGLDRWRPRLWHRTRGGGPRAVRVERDCRRSFGRHAAGGQAPAAGLRQRRGSSRRARIAADRNRHARRRNPDDGAAPHAGSGGGARRRRAHDAQRRTVAGHRHAAARPRGIPSADGPRLAWLFRGSDAQAVDGCGIPARRVRPQGDPAGRAGDAGPDGAARALQGQAAAGRREDHGQPAHDDSDRGAHRDARRARRRRALGLVQHLLDAGPRRGGGGRRPSRTGGTAENPTGIPVFAWKGRRSRSTGGARARR